MGASRFDTFHQHLGIARNILTDRLETLVASGIMSRTPSPESARIFDYRLTDKGLALFPVIAALMQWGDNWINSDIGPPTLLLERKTQQPVRKIDIRSEAGRPLSRSDIDIVAGPGATPAMRKRMARR
jgi:DNA-binding HxlR family transcriptional regulator